MNHVTFAPKLLIHRLEVVVDLQRRQILEFCLQIFKKTAQDDDRGLFGVWGPACPAGGSHRASQPSPEPGCAFWSG